MLPKARLENLSVRELPDEMLVYDLTSHKTHCLNPTSALVWRHCDGRTSLAELSRLVQQRLPLGDADAVVRLALEQLSRRGLLEAPVLPLTDAARASRRAALKKLALAAAALPLVMTISNAARAQSSLPPTVITLAPGGPPIPGRFGSNNIVFRLAAGQPCSLNSQCISLNCVGAQFNEQTRQFAQGRCA
jgi:hypothetical protein